MMETVIVSSWRRADYLSHTLRALSKARGIENKLVRVFQNNRRDEGISLHLVHNLLATAESWFRNFQVTGTNYSDGEYPGWVWGQYDAWKAVYETGASRVYFFSDDDVCTPDYFEWHDAVQTDGDWFASCAWRWLAPTGEVIKKPFDLEAYYQVSYPCEIGRGLGINHDKLGVMLQSPPIWCHPTRMVEENWKIVMPYVQRIYHAGTRSSHLLQVEENFGAAVDYPMPDPIPDYGRQKAVLKP